jgi:hypothetical protein
MRGRNTRFIPYRERLRMKGDIVKAIGCCGEGTDREVVGELVQISPFAVVRMPRARKGGKTFYQLFEVNPNTLEVISLKALLS